LRIADASERQQALMEYARSLQINTEKTTKANGKIDEDQLTVRIFNVERTRTMFRFRKLGFFLGALFMFVILIAAIMVYSRIR
jgi:hypothetical protein